jgi:hypothetical protein
MTEYVFSIHRRDPARPLAAELIVEFGCDEARGVGVVEAVSRFADMLRELKTPERVADAIRREQDRQLSRILLAPRGH